MGMYELVETHAMVLLYPSHTERATALRPFFDQIA